MYGFARGKLLALDDVEVDLLQESLGDGLDVVVDQHSVEALREVLQHRHARHLRQVHRQVGEREEDAVEESDEVAEPRRRRTLQLGHDVVVVGQLDELVDFGDQLRVDLLLGLDANVLEYGTSLEPSYVGRLQGSTCVGKNP